jgi:hypothetical protein
MTARERLPNRRDARGQASGPLGVALDLIAQEPQP